MTVELTPEMEMIVADRLSSGRNASAQAVLEEAFRALQLQHAAADLHKRGANAQTDTILSQEEREKGSRSMDELFARVDAAGGFDFQVERDRTPPREVEFW